MVDIKKVLKKVEEDSFELTTANEAEFSAVLGEFQKERKWYTSDEECAPQHSPGGLLPKANVLKFVHLNNEPLMAPALMDMEFKVKEILPNETVAEFTAKLAKDVSMEALLDTMSEDAKHRTKHVDGYHGTSLMAFINGGAAYPVGWSAIPALQAAIGIRDNGQTNLQSYSPARLASVYTTMASAALGKGFTACTAYGKWRAFNGPRYAVADEKMIWDACQEMLKKYPKATFAKGYINHGYTRWIIDLTDYQQDLFGQYAAAVGNNFTPILIISTSMTGESAVNINPGLKIGSFYVPLAQNVSRRHTAPGNYAERIANMKTSVAQAFDEVMPRFEDAAKEAIKLQGIDIKYGRTTLERAASYVNLPQKETFSQADIFDDIYAEDINGVKVYTGITAYDIWLYLCEIVFEAEMSGKYNQLSLIGMADGLERAVRVDWSLLDDGKPVSWVKTPKKP